MHAPTKRLLVGVDASRAFGALPTGTENYSTRVIEELAAGGAHSYRLYFREPFSCAVPSGTEVRTIRCPRLWTHVRLALEIARNPPDVLFVPAHVRPLISTVPTVVTVHDVGHRAYPEAHTLRQRAYLEWSTRHHVRRATRLVADSQATRADLIDLYGAAPSSITVAHLGVDATMAPPRPKDVAALRVRYELPVESPYFLHVGTIQPRKNLTRLVEAFQALARETPGPILILAGKRGWGQENPMVRARELGLGDRVRHLGYVQRSELATLYGGALACVVPSLWEGFGLTALEAMACGTPVAVSRGSSLEEVVGPAGLTFDPLDVAALASVLRRLLREDELRRSLSRAGRVRAQQFTWARCARKVREAIEAAAMPV